MSVSYDRLPVAIESDAVNSSTTKLNTHSGKSRPSALSFYSTGCVFFFYGYAKMSEKVLCIKCGQKREKSEFG